MAKKKNELLDGLMDVLGESGGDILSDLIEGLTGEKISSTQSEDLLEGILQGGGNLLGGLGDVVSDLTGIGAQNTQASETAKLSGKTKSSASEKKVIKSSGRKTTAKKETTKKTSAKKETAKKTSEKKETAKKPASSKSSAAKKTKTSAAKKTTTR